MSSYFKSFPRIPVLVITNDGANPLGIARALGRAGIRVSVLTTAKNPVLRSCRYIKKVYHVSSFQQHDEVRGQLEKFISEQPEKESKPLFWVTNEDNYSEFLPFNDFLQEHFNIVNPLERGAFLSQKCNQFPLAEQAGFTIPQSFVLRSVTDLDTVENSLRFPVLVKPVAMRLRGDFLYKTMLYEDIKTLKTSLSPFLQSGKTELIAQEFVAGSDKNIRWYFASCGENGEPRLWLTGHKIRQNPPGRGVMASGVVDRTPDLDFVEKSKNLCRLFGMKGFIGIECKFNESTGKYYYIESSLRADAYNSICFAAGVDIVLDSYLASIAVPCQSVQLQSFHGSWADFELDLGTMKCLRQQRDPSWKQFFNRLPRPIAWAYFTWDDPMPFAWHLWKLIRRRFGI
jgi:predicted ATP-grasp superfamily ATP-dependent carboligase